MKNIESVLNRFLRRFFRRWKWPMLAILTWFLMIYVMYWMDVLETVITPGLTSFLTFFTLLICFLIIGGGVLYELKVKFRIFYVCQNCGQNFVFEGRKNPDIKCPYCSSENLRVAATIPLKEHPRGLVWNPPEESTPTPKEKEFKICPMCGSVEDIASPVCSKCSYKFEAVPSK